MKNRKLMQAIRVSALSALACFLTLSLPGQAQYNLTLAPLHPQTPLLSASEYRFSPPQLWVYQGRKMTRYLSHDPAAALPLKMCPDLLQHQDKVCRTRCEIQSVSENADYLWGELQHQNPQCESNESSSKAPLCPHSLAIYDKTSSEKFRHFCPQNRFSYAAIQGNTLLILGESGYELYQLPDLNPIAQWEAPANIQFQHYAHSATHFALGTAEQVQVFDIKTGKPTRTLTLRAPYSQLHLFGNFALMQYGTRRILMLELDTGKVFKRLEIPQSTTVNVEIQPGMLHHGDHLLVPYRLTGSDGIGSTRTRLFNLKDIRLSTPTASVDLGDLATGEGQLAPLGTDRFLLAKSRGFYEVWSLTEKARLSDFQLFVLNDGFMAITPEGYFTGQGSYQKQLAFKKGPVFLSFGEISDIFYRPDLLNGVFQGQALDNSLPIMQGLQLR